MAATRTPIEAFAYAKEYIKQMPLERVQIQIVNEILARIWMAAPWRWTMGVCQSVPLAGNVRDVDVVAPPADFLYISRAYIWDGKQQNNISPEPALPDDVTIKGLPTKVAYLPTSYTGSVPKFRLDPVPSTQNTQNPYKLICWYKKTAPVITAANLNTAGALQLDDEWYWAFQEGVLWKSYLYADDGRAGGVVVQGGNVQFSGQRAAFEDAINQMRISEPMLTQFNKLSEDPKKDRG